MVARGPGPRPKPADQRARRNKDPIAQRTYQSQPATPPKLPPTWVDHKGVKRRWPARTRRWWATWCAEPLAVDFTDTDWDFMLDTALLHAKAWGDGDMSVMGELRIRVSKLGATSEDRARLRIVYANADEADDKRDRSAERKAAKAYDGLKAV